MASSLSGLFMLQHVSDRIELFSKSNGEKPNEDTGTGTPSGSMKASLTPNPASSRSNKPPFNPKSGQNRRSRRTQPAHCSRKASPRFSPGRSRRSDMDSDRQSPMFRRQSPPRRPPSPPKMFDQLGSARRSDNDGNFSRIHPPRQSFIAGRVSENKSSYDVRSGPESRSSPYQHDSQRGIPRPSSSPTKREVGDRSVTGSYRFNSGSDSRPR
ncbi:hypothetical protein BVRB_022330, partial [Beta vulgaris subsp. vulgaris]